jgi:hypothetical protein
MKMRHVGLRPGLVDEDQALGINPPLILPPLRPPARHVGAILLGGVQAFLKVTFSARKKFQIALPLTRMPRAASSPWTPRSIS